MVEEKFDDRWSYGDCDFARAAYVLDPEFSHDQASNKELMEGFMNVAVQIN